LGLKDCLTKEEEVVLADIRALREKAINIKNRLKRMEGRITGDMSGCQEEIQSVSAERQALIDELDDLRKNKKELDRLMEEAHHRKMALLGHKEP
jgi:chaperonin cofactor prefoldin